MNSHIYIMTHKTFTPPSDSTYLPLHVGSALGQELGYLRDDSGENISALNPFYGELTGMYWLWHNCPNVDIVGTCHYRRYFINESQALLNANDCERILSDYDVIAPKKMDAEQPYLATFAESHNVEDLLLVADAIEKLYPEYGPAFEEAMQSNLYFYGNLLVMKKDLYDKYCEWLFTLFAEVGEHLHLENYDNYHKRIFGFLSENLISVFILSNQLKVYECPVILTSEKAETTEFKLAIGQLVAQGQFTEAKQLFYDYQKLRPDIRLPQSDIRGEIPVIELILYILEQEKSASCVGLYEVSHKLTDLITYMNQIYPVIKKQLAGNALSSEEENILSAHAISSITRDVIRIN